jgi:hypothetical protein
MTVNRCDDCDEVCPHCNGVSDEMTPIRLTESGEAWIAQMLAAVACEDDEPPP